jgi:Ca2+/H+ antiporter
VAGPDRVLAGVAAVLLGLAYGLCLVSGLRQAEQMAAPDERGAVVACYYALAYLGFAAPYLAAGLGAAAGKAGAFTALTAIIAGLALWTAGYAARLRRTARQAEADSAAGGSAQDGNSGRGQVTHHPVRHNLKDFRAERGHVPPLLPVSRVAGGAGSGRYRGR